MSAPNPRKRPVPGASPMLPMQQIQQPYVAQPQDQMMRWNGGVMDGNNLLNAGANNVHDYGMMPAQNHQFAQGVPTQNLPQTSTALTRRQPSRSLVPASLQAFDANSELWANFGDDAGMLQPPNGGVDENDNIELLEERAQKAKREAQAKRKQIPPFVQKLSSFLEEEKNTELIRWSQNGDSFIVLDEDEFAKTLIPELFKHNNYASFVRQLNMYGFHKRVGLSDNSMKASERKNKSPSEYYNPYFKRGHPNLLWLINKPKSGGKQKKGKKEDGDADSDEEVGVEELPAPGIATHVNNNNNNNNNINQPGRPGSIQGEVGPLQKKELAMVREQLDQVQNQQKAISEIIRRLRQDHQNLYQQALVFQTMHDRHENSINAILNFLANVFRKSLEEQGGSQSVSDLLASIIPNVQMPQGSVVDLDDVFQQQDPVPKPMGTPKRQQRLLPPIPNNRPGGASGASPVTAADTPSGYVPAVPQAGRGQSGTITELSDSPSDSTSSPRYIKQELRSNPQEGMMRIIQDTNAGNPTGMNLPEMVANTSATLSNDQRQKMLNIMAGQAAAGRPSPVVATTTAGGSTTSATTPTPAPSQSARPRSPAAASSAASNSLSPLVSSVPPPSMQHIEQNIQDLDALSRMQERQNSAIDSIQHILGPLSPSGRIPGIDDALAAGSVGSYFPNVDGGENYDEFFDANAFANDLDFSNVNFTPGATGPTDGTDFNFSLDGGGGGGGGGNNASSFEPGHVIESNSATNTSSPSGTEEVFIFRDDNSPSHSAKRRRQG